MIEAITPLVLQTIVQAGAPLTTGALMERIRSALSERNIRHHLRDLLATGQLSIQRLEHSPHNIICVGANASISTIANPYFGKGDECRQLAGDIAAKRRRPKLPRDHVSPSVQAIDAAAKRNGRQSRMAPVRTAILELIEKHPLTSREIADALDLSREQALEHITLLRRDGLALRYDTTNALIGIPAPIWVGAQLRARLPDPEPQPKRASYYSRKQQKRGRVAPTTSATTGAPTP